MSNQKKNIENLGYARHGYPGETSPKTVKEIEGRIERVASNLNNVKDWQQPMALLLRMSLEEFVSLQYDCCLVASDLEDFPEDLKETDNMAYLFTNRNDTFGVQELIGASSGLHFSRRMNDNALTGWTAVQGDAIYYATFAINIATGMLEMSANPGYSGANFNIDNGNLIVTI